ncbi:MAG: AAA family ATPase [Clostridia bacterium]|nr:AAA family ATPase [Clostridia bacterium]
MIFKRKAYEQLSEWKKCGGRRAILIEGARRVGKSTTVTRFAEKEYKSYILINFDKESSAVRRYFEEYMGDLDTFFMFLSSAYRVQLYERESVIIFDEVQEFPRARECIKFLVEDGRYDYIETGSLVSIRKNVADIIIPSEERSFKMYPMDFEEFCWALGDETMLSYIKDCFVKEKALDGDMHKKAMLLFKQYMLVGGMPQVVAAFVDGKKDLNAADEEKRDILNLYRDDIWKVPTAYTSKVAAIYDQIPGLLSKHEKKVVYSDISPKSGAKSYEDAFFWLADSMICNVCFNCSDPETGFARNGDRTYIKCYMGDTGLLISHAFGRKDLEKNDIYNLILNDKLSINKGMLYENMIAQMLVDSGYPLYFYTHYNTEKKRNDIEIDFLVSESGTFNRMYSPIEVKSTTRYTTTSLTRFKDKFGKRIVRSIVIHPGNLRVEGDILCIPPYMTFCL